MEKVKYLLGSRKFWAALIGLVFVVIKAYDANFPLQEDMLTNVVVILSAYILGVAIDSPKEVLK